MTSGGSLWNGMHFHSALSDAVPTLYLQERVRVFVPVETFVLQSGSAAAALLASR